MATYEVTVTGTNFNVSLTPVEYNVNITQLADSEIAARVTEAQDAATLAGTHKTDAEAARDASQAARDTANLHKLAAEAAATSATNTAAALTGFDLEAIAETKAVTAVDVFVYDTSKDSDGGAWRKRTQGTSWYNEALNTATRGSRREFPAVAVIVAEAAKVTIYDGDDPALPMWMVFNAGGTNYTTNNMVSNATGVFSSLSMKNGLLCAGLPFDALKAINFISDDGRTISTGAVSRYNGPITDRNNGRGSTAVGGGTIVSFAVNDVAMTVLPDAPIDPATGLPVPTIAVATAGGVSVITDSGAVADGNNTAYGSSVSFFEEGEYLLSGRVTQSTNQFAVCSSEDYQTDGFDIDRLGVYNSASTPALLPSKPSPSVGYASGSGNVIASWNDNGDGLALISQNPATSANGMVAYTTSTYNTGWMPGDIKGAFLSDTDDTDLVGSGELVTNGTFDTDTTGWTVSAGLSATVSGGQVTLTNDTGFSPFAENIRQTVTGLIVGETYTFSFDYISGTNRVRAVWGAPFTQIYSDTTTTFTFVATATSANLVVYLDAASLGNNATIDNVSLKLADADRSVNNNGLVINGTITRTYVDEV